jgi:hypothetical protein
VASRVPEAPARRYIALIGDIRGSREHEDRSRLQGRFARTLQDAGDPSSPPASGPTVTTGDEFQALFTSASGIEPFLLDVTEGLHPVELRFGLGQGPLETAFREEAIGMDGPCLHRARSALERAEDDEAWVRAEGFGARLDTGLDAFFDLVASVRDRWTDRQREFAEAYRELGVQQAVADRFDVSKSTVSESLASAHVHEVRRAERALADLLAEGLATPEGPP